MDFRRLFAALSSFNVALLCGGVRSGRNNRPSGRSKRYDGPRDEAHSKARPKLTRQMLKAMHRRVA